MVPLPDFWPPSISIMNAGYRHHQGVERRGVGDGGDQILPLLDSYAELVNSFA
jgi:hypothetical protein